MCEWENSQKLGKSHGMEYYNDYLDHGLFALCSNYLHGILVRALKKANLFLTLNKKIMKKKKRARQVLQFFGIGGLTTICRYSLEMVSECEESPCIRVDCSDSRYNLTFTYSDTGS